MKIGQKSFFGAMPDFEIKDDSAFFCFIEIENENG
jgi:hypothetical protein